jgi:hypothetical protein
MSDGVVTQHVRGGYKKEIGDQPGASILDKVERR